MLLRDRGSPNHLLRNWLMVLSSASTVVMGTSYTRRGQRSLGRIPCWYTQVLYFPGSPDLSTAVSQFVTSLLVCWRAAVSFRELSKIFPKLLTGLSVTDGICDPYRVKRNRSATLPFFKPRDLDLAGLKLILAHRMRRWSPWSSHLHPGTEAAVTVRSSIKALMGGCRVPDLDMGPLHFTSADLTIMFMARAKSGTEIVQPVMMPFSSRCQADVAVPDETLNLKLL